ncbi:MAG TPA: VOC family protein [Stellaceae bacterium]|nr:VOC family protein [Stellaceae bacterium]
MTTPQLAGPGAVFLDHIAHFVPTMEPAAAALESCGFRLTPFTAQTNREGGATVLSGTGNRCAMLRNGYVELLVATSDSPLSRQLNERIADHVGLHLAAFGTADAAGEHARLAGAGFPTLPLVDMRRPVTLGGVTEDACFSIARVAHGTMPEGRAQFLTHHTEHLVWRDDYLDHPNGAFALNALWIAADDPAEPAARFARFTGRPAQPRGEVMTIRLDRGAIHVATPALLGERMGIAPAGSLPCFVAATILVADLSRLEDCLDRSGIARRRVALPGGNEAVAVALPSSLGDTMLFRAG